MSDQPAGSEQSGADITIYTTRFCGFCVSAKRLLSSKRVSYVEIAVDGDRAMRAELLQRSGSHTVPQIWFGEHYIGGCNELHALERSGKFATVQQEFAPEAIA